MIAVCKDRPSKPRDWQSGFVAMLSEIEQRLHQTFRNRDAASREDAVADGVVLCLLSYRRLHQRGRSMTAASLAWYAAKQVRSGRGTECQMNSKNPLSRYAQLRRGIRVERLHESDPHDRDWIDAVVQDRQSSVLDQVAARLDIAAWLATLSRRTRHIATDLALGGLTSDTARKFGVSAGRISQLRRELAESWGEFQHEPTFVS
jgi:hypothetical protein